MKSLFYHILEIFKLKLKLKNPTTCKTYLRTVNGLHQTEIAHELPSCNTNKIFNVIFCFFFSCFIESFINFIIRLLACLLVLHFPLSCFNILNHEYSQTFALWRLLIHAMFVQGVWKCFVAFWFFFLLLHEEMYISHESEFVERWAYAFIVFLIFGYRIVDVTEV